MVDDIRLTRRQILAGLGAVGLSGAGVGFGSTALLSDEAALEGNAIAAGALDLRVAWEEHYSFPQGIDETAEDPTDGLDVRRSGPNGGDYVGLPDPTSPVVWVHRDDLDAYLARTAIDAYPDPDNDGRSAAIGGDDAGSAPCTDWASGPEALDPAGRRTANADTAGDDGAPLLDLTDVKPGDFGTVTMNAQLCENPGYLWLRAEGVEHVENGVVGDETSVDDTTDRGELAAKVRTAWWYDASGNAVVDETVARADVMVAVDTSQSHSQRDVDSLASAATELAAELDAAGDVRVGGLTFGDGEVSNVTGLADGPVAFGDLATGGNSPLPAALEISGAELTARGRPGADTLVVVLTDGGPNYREGPYAAGGHTVGTGYEAGSDGESDDRDESVVSEELCETARVAEDVREEHAIVAVGIDDRRPPLGNRSPRDCTGDRFGSLSQYLRDEVAGDPAAYVRADRPQAVGDVLAAIERRIATTETVFHRGTLADDLAALARGRGVALDPDDPGVDAFADPSTDLGCVPPGQTVSIGFAWWLPLDVANEIQGDAVRFDLGLSAEQCRHNGVADGSP